MMLQEAISSYRDRSNLPKLSALCSVTVELASGLRPSYGAAAKWLCSMHQVPVGRYVGGDGHV